MDAAERRFAYSLGLLHDLLEHEVRITALFGRGNIPVDRVVLFFDGLLHCIIKLHLIGGDDGYLAVLHIRNVARVLYYRGDVACYVVAALAVADKQRRILARGDEMLRLVNAQYAQRIRALDAAQHAEHRFKRIAALGIVERNELANHLGVGVGDELIAVGYKKIAQLDIVFDYAVVNNGDLAVAAEMGMGVDVVRLAVRCPACVADADRALDAFAALDHIPEHLQASL